MAEAIKELDIDGVKVLVADLSDGQKRYVHLYQNANEKKVELENEILTLSAALRTLSNDLVVSIRADRAKVEAAMAAADGSEMEAPVDQAPVDPAVA